MTLAKRYLPALVALAIAAALAFTILAASGGSDGTAPAHAQPTATKSQGTSTAQQKSTATRKQRAAHKRSTTRKRSAARRGSAAQATETDPTAEAPEGTGEQGSAPEPAGEATPGYEDPAGQDVQHECPPACDQAAGELP